MTSNVAYRVGNAIIYSNLDLKKSLIYSYYLDLINGPSTYRAYLGFLFERALRGDFGEDVKKGIEMARRDMRIYT